MKKRYVAVMAVAGLIMTISAGAQSTLSTPFTLTAGYGPTYLMLTWDPINGFVTRTSGQTTVVYFTSPQPADMDGDPAEPAQIASYGYGGYTSNLNGITSGEEAYGTLLNSSSQFSDPSSSMAAFNPADNEAASFFGMDYNAGNGNYNYGWVEYTTTTNSFTLDEAYMNTTVNQSATVGEGISAAPEPSSIAFESLGVFSLLFIFCSRARKQL